MSARLRACFVAAACACAPVPPLAAPPAEISPPPVGADALWVPPAGFLEAMHRSCDGRSGADFGACFVAAMEKAGAPPAAVAFARRTSDQVYLRQFRDAGLVDVACAEYPFRANENAVCFLVNGSPPMIDVDDPAYVERQTLLWNPVYAGLARTHPNLAVFPGRRSGEGAVAAGAVSNGGQRFRVEYSLTDGCHACARLGSLRMDFDFDVRGRFVGTKVASVHALAR